MKWVNSHEAAKNEVKKLHAQNLELWNENIKLNCLVEQLQSKSIDANLSHRINGR